MNTKVEKGTCPFPSNNIFSEAAPRQLGKEKENLWGQWVICVKAPYNACIYNLNLCVEEPPSQYIGSISNALSVHPPQEEGERGRMSQGLLPNSSWELRLLQLIHKQKAQNLCTPLRILSSAIMK